MFLFKFSNRIKQFSAIHSQKTAEEHTSASDRILAEAERYVLIFVETILITNIRFWYNKSYICRSVFNFPTVWVGTRALTASASRPKLTHHFEHTLATMPKIWNIFESYQHFLKTRHSVIAEAQKQRKKKNEVTIEKATAGKEKLLVRRSSAEKRGSGLFSMAEPGSPNTPMTVMNKHFTEKVRDKTSLDTNVRSPNANN